MKKKHPTWEQMEAAQRELNVITPQNAHLFIGEDFKKGDRVRCKGVGYPHWKDRKFTVEVVFENDTIGLDNKIRVAAWDFEKI